MTRNLLLSTLLMLILLLITMPAAAQTINIASAVEHDTALESHLTSKTEASTSPAVQLGFPTLRKPLPAVVYPVNAEQFQIEGRVLVEYTVDKRGRARDIRIISGPGAGCKKEVLRVLRAARFNPMLDTNDQPVAARFRSAFDFKLN